MDLDFSIDLIVYAFKKDIEQTAWELWISKYPWMDEENFISFDEFKAGLFEREHTEISYEDIENEMDRVVKAYEGQVK